MRYTGPTTKYYRRFKLLPESPNEKQPRRRKSDYGVRLEEKQKLKFLYGVPEKQFRRYFQKAISQPQNTGLVLLQQLESRLDNTIYRLGFASTRAQARQLVNHGHVLVDGDKVDIPSYNVRVGQSVTLKSKVLENPFVQEALNNKQPAQIPAWLKRKGPIGKVGQLPAESDLRQDINTNLIVEYYSR